MTAKNEYVLAEAVRSIVGEVTEIKPVGERLQLVVSPLGISPDFVIHDPAQGAWVRDANNSGFIDRREQAKDKVPGVDAD